MANAPYVSDTAVASSVPFDNSDATLGYDVTDVQLALEELRERTIYTSTTQATTLNGTRTLVRADNTLQIFTGTATGYSVVLPNATTLTLGRHFKIDNVTTQSIAVKDGSGALLFNLSPSSIGELTLQANPTSAGSWIWWQTLVGVANGVITYNITSTTNFTTSSNTDVIVTGMTVTPSSGTYGVWYNGAQQTSSSGATVYISLYDNGVAVADSSRDARTAAANSNLIASTMSIIQFDGASSCAVYTHVIGGGSTTVGDRSLLLIRLGA